MQRQNRRDLLKLAGIGPFFLFPARTLAQRKRLKILRWSGFSPGYDQWFDMFARAWDQKHDTRIIVDRAPLEQIHACAAVEAASGRGHDIVMFPSPPAAFEKRVIDHRDVYREAERKHGKMIALAHKSTFNPQTKRYFAFADFYVPAVVHWRKDYWQQAGFPNGPDSYAMLRLGARKIREEFGISCGVGLAPELDSNVALRAILWSFGASVQDERGNITINSRGTIEALKYVKALYREAQTEEVCRWTPASNDREMLAGRLSCTMNAICIIRQAEKENADLAGRILLSPAPKGPDNWLACPHAINCSAIWEFAGNREGAKQFLVDLIDDFATAFRAGEFCCFPCFPATVPDLKVQIANDPWAEPQGKYRVLVDVLEWTANVGHPGYATAAIDEVLRAGVVPLMFAGVAKGDLSPEEGAAIAEENVRRIFEKWKGT